jgi:protein TonB
MIACKTIEHYHVENCQELDESPPGSGLARALRQAAWQFLVRPVRVDGHVMIGSWVRIKFTFTKAPSSGPVESTMPGADEGR